MSSNRRQSIRNLFAGDDEQALAEDARQPVQRVASGAVKSLKDTFSSVERDYEELKKQVANGSIPVELDPDLIDPSPFADRFADQDAAAVEALTTSIREHGQEIPILVRPHPTEHGRYQIAYGHRRVKAATDLGLQVKAYVRDLSNDRLVVAQGIENSAREDLTFIERASFALKLEVGGFQRSLIQTALSVDRQETSKLLSVAKAVPAWLVEAIGRAPKIGRPRWQELADLLKASDGEQKARRAIDEKSFTQKESDDRFLAVLRAGKAQDAPAPSPDWLVARSTAGAEIATLALSAKHCRIQIDRGRDGDFAQYVMQQLPELYEDFRNKAVTSEEK